jgi:Domain of unknown function (DU1801)
MDVNEFIINLPKAERIIVSRLRDLLFETEPRFREKLSYGVPYFSRNRRVCFLWPASAPLGPTNAKVSFGFCYANLLSNAQGLLLKEGRRQVYITRFSSVNEIDEKLLLEIIHEALLVDDLHFQKKNQKKI